MRLPDARVWARLTILGPSIEVMVKHGRVRVIICNPEDRSLPSRVIEECEVRELWIEEWGVKYSGVDQSTSYPT